MKYVFSFASNQGPQARFFSDAAGLIAYTVGWAKDGEKLFGFHDIESGIWGFLA